jgi:hypothetical protein
MFASGHSQPGQASGKSAQIRHASESGSQFRTLPQLASRRDRQRADDLVAAHHYDLIHHVDDDADVVRHDAHDVADIGAGVAADHRPPLLP